MASEGKLMREQHRPIMEGPSKFRFGNYDLVRRIDVGGMGEVYLARQRTAFEREVAIKIIRSDLVHDITARARFLREAEVSSHLKHEHILPLFEFGEEQGRLFLVTPYIEGGTLARRLMSGPLPLPEVYRLFTALVQAVAYIHRRGVIHRDLKPSNILLDNEDGKLYVRLIDFGIATLQGRSASPPLTTAGTEMGTIAYMAPERLSGIAAPSNDIFSLGVILYQMLTGHLPSIEQHTRLPQPLEYVVHHCLAPQPEDRFATAEELLKTFERAFLSLNTLPKLPATPPSTSSNTGESPSIVRENTPPPTFTNGSVISPKEERVMLQNSGAIPTFEAAVSSPISRPQAPQAFGSDDYSAPTTSIGSPPLRDSGKKNAFAAPPVKAPPPARSRKKRGRSLMAVISILIILVLGAIGGLGYYEYHAISITSVNVNFAPQTHLISQVYSLTAQPSAKSITVSNSSIPAKVLVTAKSGSQTGPTTGQQCVLGIFDCQQTVDAADVSTLAAQIRPVLTTQVTQDMQNQVQSQGAKAVGTVHFADLSESAEPPVGAVSKSVTVTLKVQGTLEYIVNADAQNLTRQLLIKQAQAFGPNYILLSQSIKIGQPVVESLDETTGVVTIKVPAGGVVQYKFPVSEVQVINNYLKSKPLNAALAYLAKQPGVDPKTVSIHFTQGKANTLPDDIKHIRIITLNPETLPVVQLPAVT